jgi:hypothetical protein
MKLAYILAIMIAMPVSSAPAAPARKGPSQPLLQAKPYSAYGSQRRHTDPDPQRSVRDDAAAELAQGLTPIAVVYVIAAATAAACLRCRVALTKARNAVDSFRRRRVAAA